MPRLAKPLTALEVGRLKAPGAHAVGTVPGLHLNVKPTGARSWILRLMVGGRRREIGLGGYPAVTLAQAHDKARQARDKILAGVDPVAERKAARSALIAAHAKRTTFAEAARLYIDAHGDSWRNPKHRQQWGATLEQYANPVIGQMLVADIEKAHVLEVLNPIWREVPETASRVRGRIEKVLSFAVQAGYRPEGLNPARWKDNLDLLLLAPGKAKRGNHAALDWREVGAFWSALAGAEGIGTAALRFAILTAARSGEARGARWSEIDMGAGIWEIPAARMKSGREHRVPLSKAALDLLRDLPRYGDTELIFPSPHKTDCELSDATLGATIKRLHEASVAAGGEGWIDRKQNGRIATAHGIARSTFRTWAGEATAYPRDLCEAALAHVISDKTEAAYQRGDLLERRRRLMDDWSRFLATPSAKAGKVMPIRGAA